MPDILIRGMEMPKDKDHLTITINADGTVQPLVDMYCPIIAHAIELQEHGDLIDRDALGEAPTYYGSHCNLDEVEDWINSAPVVIPSNKEVQDALP